MRPRSDFAGRMLLLWVVLSYASGSRTIRPNSCRGPARALKSRRERELVPLDFVHPRPTLELEPEMVVAPAASRSRPSPGSGRKPASTPALPDPERRGAEAPASTPFRRAVANIGARRLQDPQLPRVVEVERNRLEPAFAGVRLRLWSVLPRPGCGSRAPRPRGRAGPRPERGAQPARARVASGRAAAVAKARSRPARPGAVAPSSEVKA